MSATPNNSQETVLPVQPDTDSNGNVAGTQEGHSTQLSEYSEPSQNQKEVLAEKLSQTKSQPPSQSQTTTDRGTQYSSQRSNHGKNDSQGSDGTYQHSQESRNERSSGTEEI